MTSRSEWCETHLGAPVERVLWETGHLSEVVAAALRDGREVVVKIRPWDAALAGCAFVHRHIHDAGFPCPEPLIGPLPFADGVVASAEAHMPGGAPASADDVDLAARCAERFHDLICLAPPVEDTPSLNPPRAWAGWSHPEATPWPPPDEGIPLSGNPDVDVLVPLAEALNDRLTRSALPAVVGHVDFYQGNLRWNADGTLFALDDWDSISALPEAALVGCAAVSFRPGPRGFGPAGYPGTDVADTEEFLTAYAAMRPRSFTAEEVEIAWAAGLWQRTFDAAKRLAARELDSARAQVRDADERAARAGLPTGLLAL